MSTATVVNTATSGAVSNDPTPCFLDETAGQALMSNAPAACRPDGGAVSNDPGTRRSASARYVELNNHAFTAPRQVYDYLACELGFPEGYGHNLDALHDILSSPMPPTTIRIRRTWHQADWFRRIARVIRDAAKTSPWLEVR